MYVSIVAGNNVDGAKPTAFNRIELLAPRAKMKFLTGRQPVHLIPKVVSKQAFE